MNIRFFIAINYVNDKHCLWQLQVAKDCGADGVFLLDSMRDNPYLSNEIARIYERFPPRFFVGANFLCSGKIVEEANLLPANLDALWTDGCGRSGEWPGPFNYKALQRARDALSSKKLSTELFVSTQFKGQIQLFGDDRDREIREICSSRSVDVLCTSGQQTGTPPDVEKICSIRKVMSEVDKREMRLAVCSGVDINNVRSFMDAGATDFIVKTSIRKQVEFEGRPSCGAIWESRAEALANTIKGI